MKIHLKNISNLLILFTFLALGCLSSSSNRQFAVERGRLKYESGFFVNGSAWFPNNDRLLANRINWCDTSPNPNVEILRCFSDVTENYDYTYVVRMKGDTAEVEKFNEPLGSVWVNEDGRWLLGKKTLFNVETGEKKEVRGMPWADRADSSTPVQYILAVSPDMKTAVREYKDLPSEKGKDDFVVLQVIDLESGNLENRKVNRTKYSWIRDYEQPHENFQPPPAPSKKFVWEKGIDGKDKIKIPELLEIYTEKEQTAK